jgi:hypothetical protein
MPDSKKAARKIKKKLKETKKSLPKENVDEKKRELQEESIIKTEKLIKNFVQPDHLNIEELMKEQSEPLEEQPLEKIAETFISPQKSEEKVVSSEYIHTNDKYKYQAPKVLGDPTKYPETADEPQIYSTTSAINDFAFKPIGEENNTKYISKKKKNSY